MVYWLYQNHTWRECELEFKRAPSQIRLIFGVLFIVCGVIASAGNIVAFYYLIKPSTRITNTNDKVSSTTKRPKSDKILISLVINDLIIGLAVCPLLGFEQFFEYYLETCHFQATIISSSYFITSVTVAFIAFYRCRTLMKECDSERYLDEIHVSWWITAFWLIPPLLCIATYFISLEVYVIMVSSVFLLTLLVVSVSYVVIMRVIWKAKRLLSTNTSCKETLARFKIGRKVALLIVCYILCFFPIILMLVTNLYYLAMQRKRPPGLQVFFMSADFLACVNSCINPWVYTLKIPRLKQQLRRRRRRKELMKKYAVVIY